MWTKSSITYQICQYWSLRKTQNNLLNPCTSSTTLELCVRNPYSLFFMSITILGYSYIIITERQDLLPLLIAPYSSSPSYFIHFSPHCLFSPFKSARVSGISDRCHEKSGIVSDRKSEVEITEMKMLLLKLRNNHYPLTSHTWMESECTKKIKTTASK